MKTYTYREASALFASTLAAGDGADRPFCRPFRDWARAHPTLKDAWNACDRPAWMVWWLNDHLRVIGIFEMGDLMNRIFGENNWNLLSATVDSDGADFIRSGYTYYGTTPRPATLRRERHERRMAA